MKMLGFYYKVFKRAFRGWWGRTRAIVFLVTLLPALWRYFINPTIKLPLNLDEVLFLCVAASIIWSALYVIRAIYLLYADEKTRADGLQDRFTPRINLFLRNNGVQEEKRPTRSKWVQIGVSCATKGELEDCEVVLVSAKRICDNSDNHCGDELVSGNVHCVWANYEITRLSLRPDLKYYANIFHVQPREIVHKLIYSSMNAPSNVKIVPLTRPEKIHLTDGIDEPGQYRLEIRVTAAKGVRTAVE